MITIAGTLFLAALVLAVLYCTAKDIGGNPDAMMARLALRLARYLRKRERRPGRWGESK